MHVLLVLIFLQVAIEKVDIIKKVDTDYEVKIIGLIFEKI